MEIRSLPGYTARAVIRTPMLRVVPGGGFRPVELLFDPASRRLVPMSVIRMAGRNAVSLTDLIGWNSPDEAVFSIGPEIAVLRRRP
jgi:hypothetical protein